MSGSFTAAAAGVIFTCTYFVLAIGKLPGFHLDRTGAALLGASLMVAFGVLSPAEAFRAIDGNTIVLLLGMMIVVANLKLSGFFRLATNWIALHARHPLILLCAIVFASGFFSAFLVNDTICLALAPLVFDVARRLRRNPVPYLLALAMASNCGSTATITGNPQNIVIGSLSQIPYDSFAIALSPIAMVGLLLTTALIALLFPAEFWTRERLLALPERGACHGALMIKTLLIAAALVILFFAGAAPAKAAVLAGGLLLLTRIVKNTKIYFEIDWPLLLMFAGLFIVVAGFEKSLLSPAVIDAVGRLHLERVPVLSVLTAVLSNIVSNVPAVLVLRPFILALHDPKTAWLTVAMASTLAGNFTVPGSVANLIVVQKAASRGVNIAFRDYFKVGAPLTVLTIIFGVVWLAA
ncbi:MAG TPA: anion transporter [Rhizomicrobium sp.]|jgi:Na+/H+ antiporter NhaD/arsenite permease-like protein|nr:anion transporter [Rhizomicrobium sp.]